MSDSDVTGATPAGAPAGGSSLSGDDDPTGNDGTMGKDTPSGDAGTGTFAGAADNEDSVSGDAASGTGDETATGGSYSDDSETNTEIKEELDR
jgi:hypothetical protein